MVGERVEGRERRGKGKERSGRGRVQEKGDSTRGSEGKRERRSVCG